MLTALALIAAVSVQLGPVSQADSTPARSILLGPTLSMASLTAPLDGKRLSLPEDSPEEAPQLVEYSDAYLTRLKIHRWASYLTLPLFAGEYVAGRRLQNGHGSHNLLRLHRGLAAGIGGLFVVNTITGGLNLLEARKDPEGRNRRTLHSALMLLADAGFVATGILANTRVNGDGTYTGPATSHAHRNMAIASMATALVGYAIMLPPFRKE